MDPLRRGGGAGAGAPTNPASGEGGPPGPREPQAPRAAPPPRVRAAHRVGCRERGGLGEGSKTLAAVGVGFLLSVRDVRARGEEALLALTGARAARLLARGSTTIEGKSGYGLDPATELKQLRALATVAADARPALVPTFLGAHEVPPEFRDRRADYVRLLCDDLIPTVAQERLAVACDVFCEPGAFDVAESRATLPPARAPCLGPQLS